ncbi:hypothetical protein D9615_005670 [Tricholomella constricta]|uniref:Uncharacterized protein n=1 Tax=Tricholomella constricta TaxID=117010 RepID=A0A8H5HAI3_9AGAR|nr:hypothetical protein D9615_005670 [Tricholomella constricta]
MQPRNLSTAKRARYNQELQQAQDDSLAAFLADRNLPVPPALLGTRSGFDGHDGHVRQRREKRGRNMDTMNATNEGTSLPDEVPVHGSASMPALEPLIPVPVPVPVPVTVPISIPDPNHNSFFRDSEHPTPELEDTVTPGLDAKIDDVRITAEFIDALRTATLEKSNMRPEDIQRLRDAPSDLPDDINDRHFLKALRTFLATTNASQETYSGIKRKVEHITGVTPIIHDMCVDTCVGFTGPFDALDACPKCSQPRYHPGTHEGRRQFSTIPIGPVIQALYRSEDTAALMHYLEDVTEQILKHADENGGEIANYNDTACGRESLNAWRAKKIKKGDICLQISLDGAQLYRDMESDCWIFIYIIHNLPPDVRYKKRFVIPGGFIGGPLKPKHPDSLLYPSIYHISALQNEGLHIWDASTKTRNHQSTVFITLAAADGPAMMNMSGLVGHSGKFGCRLYCGLPGRRREGDGHYYPLLQMPDNYHVAGCNHPDVTFAQLDEYRKNVAAHYQSQLALLMAAKNPTQYNSLRLSTGICKPTIFSGLRYSLGILNIFVMDLMHLTGLNDPDLLLGLWRGTIKSYSPDSKDTWEWKVLVGKVWDSHGKTIAMATPYIPSSFGRAPRNPADKINSGYKAWEFLLYLFGLGPALLRTILPEAYWINYCKFARGIQLLYQRHISPDQLKEGHRLLCKFHREYENLYIQRRADRIHLLRQSVHLLTHIAPETIRAGPLSCYAQWTMETAIGNLGEEIRQDRDPYANIAQRGILRAQINSIVAMMPGALLSDDTTSRIPRGGLDLGDSYILLRACQPAAVDVSEAEAAAIIALWQKKGWPNQDNWPRAVCCWARLRLPNGQLLRSHWMESRSRRNGRKTTVVKFHTENCPDSSFAEVQYFFRLAFGSDVHTLAVVSVFSSPDRELLKKSHQTVHMCRYMGADALLAIHVKQIDSVVAMIPYFKVTTSGGIEVPENEYFLMEKLGLEITSLSGGDEGDDEPEEGDTDGNGGI